MALFSRSKKNTKEKAAQPKADAVVAPRADLAHVLLNPRITEKASMAAGEGVYVFDIAVSANKTQVAEAVQGTYKVKPRMVRIVTVPSKAVRNMRSGKRGIKQGGKKAYVYLKKGETITLA